MKLDHEKLDVYQVSLDFAAWACDGNGRDRERVRERERERKSPVAG